jgi:DegV family protein with EDD domain
VIGRTAVVVDSAAYLPRWLVEKYGVLVAPLTVTLDGREYLEGVNLSADDFYGLMATAQEVSTSQPSPGVLLEQYRKAALTGAERVLSVHIGSGVSGTVQSARVAAESAPVPVVVVDTGQASFAEGLCAWEAIETLDAGASVEEAAERALAASAAVGNTFVVRALDLLKRGGRLAPGEEPSAAVPVLSLTPEGVRPAGAAQSLDEAVEMMAAQVARAAEKAGGRKLRVGVGHGAAEEIAHALRERVEGLAGVGEIVDYVVGPSVGAHAGPGNAGAVWVARPVSS